MLEREPLPEGQRPRRCACPVQHPRAPVPGALHLVALVGRPRSRFSIAASAASAPRSSAARCRIQNALNSASASEVALGVALGDLGPAARARRPCHRPRTRRSAAKNSASSANGCARGTPSPAARRSSPPTRGATIDCDEPSTYIARARRSGSVHRAPPAGARPARSGVLRAPCAAPCRSTKCAAAGERIGQLQLREQRPQHLQALAVAVQLDQRLGAGHGGARR